MNYSFENWEAWFAGVSLDQVAEPEPVGQAELLGLPDGAAQLVALNDGTEVEERARDGRGRDAVVGGGLVGGEVGPG